MSVVNYLMGEGDMDVEGTSFIRKGGQDQMESPNRSLPGSPGFPTSTSTPSTSGHRSRKEKLVLRSFSTENDEEMQMDFDEPKTQAGRGYAVKRGATRTKRTVSAPEHSPRKLSMPRDVDGSPFYDETSASTEVDIVGTPASGESFDQSADMSQGATETSSPKSPKKPKKRKLTSKNDELQNQREPKAGTKTKTKKRSSSLSVKDSSSSPKKSRSKSIPSVFKGNPSRKDVKHKFRVSPKKLTTPLKVIKMLKNPTKIKLYPLSGPKPAFLPIHKVVIPEKPLQTQVVVRQQRKWLPRRHISRNMMNSGTEDSNPILKQPLPLDVQHISSTKIENKSPDSPKSKLTEPQQKVKTKKRSEGEEKVREEQELMHYATGFSCLEELLDGRGKVILPELYLSMIESLSEIEGEKGRWADLLKSFRSRRLLMESRQKEVHQLLEVDSDGDAISMSASNNNRAVFQPVFRMAAVLEDKPSVSYPVVTDEELDVYENLVTLNEDFECWDDELESGNLFIDMIEMDLRTIRNNKMTMKAVARIQQVDDKNVLKRVTVKAIPVNYYESQNDHGLFIPEDKFKSRFLTNKKKVLQEINTRSLRNGKKVELKNIKLPSTKKFKSKRKRRRFAETVPEIPLACPNLMDMSTMNLRGGKKIEFKVIDTATLLQPSIKLELIPEAMMGSPVKTLQQDDYSRRVEEDLRRLEAGEDLLFFDLNDSKIPSQIERGVPSQNAVRAPFDPRYMDNLTQVSLTVPANSVSNGSGVSVSRSLFGLGSSSSTPSSSSLNSSATTHNQYFFKPIQPQPLSTQFSDPRSTIRFSKEELKSPKETDMWGRSEFSSPFTPSDPISSEQKQEQSLVRKPYSRHRQSKMYPPFDNNHCSFSEHFCSYPRAASSRFCLQHVEEGATLNFERCKYVKGSRECGKFIPKAQFQAVFCDMHARAVAKARLKKMKPVKPVDPTSPFLKDIKKDLERTQGKVLEEDGSGYYRVRRHLFAEDNEAVNNSSDSDTEDEFLVDDYVKNQGECDSDIEDDWAPASELDYDLLKNAGFYSVTEVAQIYRSKLATLEQLYVRQLDVLKKKYVERRQDFLRKTHAFRQLRTYITTDPKYISQKRGEYAEEYLQYQIKTTQDTRAFLKHAKYTGNRALMHMELMNKRHQLVDSGKGGRGRPRKGHPSETDKEMKYKDMEFYKRPRKYKRTKGQACCFVIPGGERCSEKVIPLAKHCRKHITQDPHQKLFSSCNCRFGPDTDDICSITVFSELEKFGCPLHALPIPVKDPPEGDDKKPKVEEELEKLMEKLGDSSSSSDDEESDSEEEMVREMEDLVGDEVVDLDHFKEMVNYLQKKGVDLTDTEESDDTDEEEPETPTEQFAQS